MKYPTQKHYRYVLDVHLLPHFGTMRLCEITRERIQSFLAAKFRAGLSWKTIKHIRGVLGRTLSTAEDWGYITQNAALKTQLPRRPLQGHPGLVLTPRQISDVIDRLKEPARSIAALLVLTGLKIGELFALRWKCIDLTMRTLRIAETVYDGHFDTPKTQRSARVIPVSEEAFRILRSLQQADSQPEQLVFKTASGTPLNRHNLLRRHLRPACQKLGLARIGWHSLRHAHATLLDAAGAPLGTVQALLGHSSPEITRGIYIHSIPDDQRRAVARVETLLFGPKWTQVPESPKTNAA